MLCDASKRSTGHADARLRRCRGSGGGGYTRRGPEELRKGKAVREHLYRSGQGLSRRLGVRPAGCAETRGYRGTGIGGDGVAVPRHDTVDRLARGKALFPRELYPGYDGSDDRAGLFSNGVTSQGLGLQALEG